MILSSPQRQFGRAVVSCLGLLSLASHVPVTAVSAAPSAAPSSAEWHIHHGHGFDVRMRQTSPELCAGEPGLSGYVDWDDNHLFYWAFESQNDPSKDPIILWLTGGPGASGVAYGALRELGPCLWNTKTSGLVSNRYAWSSNATVIFVDQPLNVGASYGTKRVQTLREATLDLEAFLERLFAAKPEWAALDLYIAGESYGGSYVPSLGARLIRSNTAALDKLASSTSHRKRGGFNLKGIMVGNGLMDQTVQRRGFYEMGCTMPSGPIFNETQCRDLAEHLPRCEKLEEACRDSGYDLLVCGVSDAFCQKHQWNIIVQTSRNPYDVRIDCDEDPDQCADPPAGLLEWFNSPEVIAGLGIDAGALPVKSLNMDLNADFQKSGEIGYPSHQWVTELLEQGVEVLIYAGNTDWLCTAPGMRYLVDSLAWSGNAAFRALPYETVREPCREDEGEDAACDADRRVWGFRKSHRNLAFMEIDGAGHLTPGDQPEVALDMVLSWMADHRKM